MAQTTKTRHLPGIRGQLMWFLCFICLFLLGLFWFLSTQLLEPLYTKHIEKQLTSQAESIVSQLDKAIAKGDTLSRWSFGHLFLNNEFFEKLTVELYSGGTLNSFCVDISDSTLRQIYKIENQSYCNLHETFLSDSANSKVVNTAIAMRKKCRTTPGGFVQTLNPPRLSGSAQLLVGRTTADGSYTVLVTTSLVHVAEASNVLSTLLPLAAAMIFLFAMSAAWLFSEWFTKPLRQLSSAARQMAMGNYAVQVDSTRNDELGTLARDFNHMAAEVQHAAQMQRELLANVSHDLRTPLTLIKGYAETVRDLTGDDKAHRDEQMNIIVDETDRLTALVSSVMELSKVTSGADRCQRVHFDMGQLCDEVCERYDAVCAQNNWHLELELPDRELPVYADPEMMQRALHNLLGNAMHHIGADGIFILRATPCTEGIRVEVEDHGPGIPPEDLPHIFDRYYRSRSDAGKQGTGLGLSITKAIFQQHGFRFGVQSIVGKGTTFWFIMNDLPANEKAL
ncbi:MAG: HAMP domain-containing sensor histidine kinase [Faecalibacterium prausnitzii]|nr:HAMP domain-containing histidine kinase [Faecalibacterium prausnitzii]MDY2682200.1 HAMP domain-containing sensor histidine kinase [Faecalibacterium prausnitzii]